MKETRQQIRERNLISLATFHPNDEVANKAMSRLRNIDSGYGWCPEFDYLAMSVNKCDLGKACLCSPKEFNHSELIK